MAKDKGAINDYKVINGGLWIPLEELQRLEEVFHKAYMENASNGFNAEGHRRLWHLYADMICLIQKGE